MPCGRVTTTWAECWGHRCRRPSMLSASAVGCSGGVVIALPGASGQLAPDRGERPDRWRHRR